MTTSNSSRPRTLRSRAWFDDPSNTDMTALYLERYTNFGISLAELQSGMPIIGIAQTGSDLSPCNRHHLQLAERVREGIREAGGIALEFPVHPIQETGKRPTASLDRNLAYLGLVELLFGYPIDGVVLTIGCDKTVPACLMAAATVNIPAIALSVGPMLNGWYKGERTGSGTIIWRAREMLAMGQIDHRGFIELVASVTPSTGYCNVMGTATTMNSLTEALGMSLPNSAAIPAPFQKPLMKSAGFLVLRGNLFDAAIMKTSVISEEFRARYLADPSDPEAFEGRAVVFDGPEDYHARIDDPALKIDDRTILFMRGAGPKGYPGAAEVVNMRAPAYLIREGVHSLPCVGDGRQSGTSASPSILNASPEAAAGGGLALLRTGDRVRIDLRRGEANMLVDEAELEARRASLQASGGYPIPPSQTPWQEMQRAAVGQLDRGAVLEFAVKYQGLAQTAGVPRHNH
jgi:dihydroxyacid dehydratase/phosphogluconate dehydratase